MHRSAIKKIMQRSAWWKKMRSIKRCRLTYPWSSLVGKTWPVLAAQAGLPRRSSLLGHRCWLHRCPRNGASTVVPRSRLGTSL